MYKRISIKNFKSIKDIDLTLGRVTLFIGENGAGKSNILEAISFASAAVAHKLDNEFLASRGVRASPPEFMRSAFETSADSDSPPNNAIEFELNSDVYQDYKISIQEIDPEKRTWEAKINIQTSFDKKKFEDAINSSVQKLLESEEKSKLKEIVRDLKGSLEQVRDVDDQDKLLAALNQVANKLLIHGSNTSSLSQNEWLSNFLTYSPREKSLRIFEEVGQIMPLGVHGEGLEQHLLKIKEKNNDLFEQISSLLEKFSWYSESIVTENKIKFIDLNLKSDFTLNGLHVNEGFLYLLFYYVVMLSADTPKFFAIDGVDNALNPRLCTQVMKEIIDLAKKNERQVILTAHNPAILDGFDLNDSNLALYSVSRSINGDTKISRIIKKGQGEGMKLSEAFMNGYIGGLPNEF